MAWWVRETSRNTAGRWGDGGGRGAWEWLVMTTKCQETPGALGVSCPDGGPDPEGQRIINHMVSLLMKQNPQPWRIKTCQRHGGKGQQTGQTNCSI